MSDSESRLSCHLGERACMNCGEDSALLEDGWCPDCSRPAPRHVEPDRPWDRPWTAAEREEWFAMLAEMETRG